MGKLKNYKGTITLAAGLTQSNNQNYPLMDANAVQTKEDGTRLDKTIADLENDIIGTLYVDSDGNLCVREES